MNNFIIEKENLESAYGPIMATWMTQQFCIECGSAVDFGRYLGWLRWLVCFERL